MPQKLLSRHSLIATACCIFSLVSNAQFSNNPAFPLSICDASDMQTNVQALADSISPAGGYFIFWLDQRSGAKAEIYGQRLDMSGNSMWGINGRLIAAHSIGISAYHAISWNHGTLISYLIGQDSIECMFLDSNGNNSWNKAALIATITSPLENVLSKGLLNAIPTSTGATITYSALNNGTTTAINWNKIDFEGNVVFANNSKTQLFNATSYKCVGDGMDGFYVLCEDADLKIYRVDASDNLSWQDGVAVNGIYISELMPINACVTTSHDLLVSWHSENYDLFVTKVLNTGNFSWTTSPLPMSNLSEHSYMNFKNDTAYVTWFERFFGAGDIMNPGNYIMLSKIGADGIVSPNSKVISRAYLHTFPKLALSQNNSIGFFIDPDLQLVAQGITPQNNYLWSGNKVLSSSSERATNKNDFVVLDDSNGCNPIFWAGMDGNIYGASTCSADAVLSIEPASVLAENIGGFNKISWAGFNQKPGDVYHVERSADGLNFRSLIMVRSIENTDSYQYIDERPLAGVNYYRLRLQSLSGSIFYSKIVIVKAGSTSLQLVVYPNPVRDKLFLRLSKNPPKNATVTLMDVSGRILKTVVFTSNSLSINISTMASGIYYIKFCGGSETLMGTFQKY